MFPTQAAGKRNRSRKRPTPNSAVHPTVVSSALEIYGPGKRSEDIDLDCRQSDTRVSEGFVSDIAMKQTDQTGPIDPTHDRHEESKRNMRTKA